MLHTVNRDAGETVALLNGLVSYWTLGEASGERADSHGAHPLTDNNTVSNATGHHGSDAVAASFGAPSGEYLSAADHADFDFTTGFSVSAWILMNTAINNMAIISKFNHGGNQCSWVFQTSPTVQSSGGFRVFIADVIGDDGNNFATYDSAPLVNGNWYHAVLVYDGTLAEADRVKVYQDNVLLAPTGKTGTWAASLQNSTAELRIGDFESLNRFWNGLIDEVALYNRPLNASEVAAIWNGSNGLAYESFT